METTDRNQGAGDANVMPVLASLPSASNAERRGTVSLAAGLLVGPEVKAVVAALEHPPQRPDVFATLVSVISSLTVAVKVFGSAGALNQALLVLSCCLISVVTWRFFHSRAQKTPFHDLALSWVKSLPTEPGG